MTNLSCKTTAKGRPPASKGEDKRKCILDNALTLFAQQGVSETSIAQIAHASGVTSAMVHYYFHNREGLLNALVSECLAPHVQYIWSCVTEDTLKNPRQVVTDIIIRLLEVVEELPQLPQLWNREIFHINGCLREYFMQHLPLEKFEKLRDALNNEQQKGFLYPQVSPDLVIVSAISLIMVPLSAQKYLPNIPELPVLGKDRIGKHALTLILKGIFPEKEK